MEDEEHEVYGQEIPVDGEDVDMGAGGDDAAKVRFPPVAPPPPRLPPPSPQTLTLVLTLYSPVQLHELDEMKRRLKEMEEEAAALREMQAKVAKEMQGSCRLPVRYLCVAVFKTSIRGRVVAKSEIRDNKLACFYYLLVWVC
jgi:hypothetical protein